MCAKQWGDERHEGGYGARHVVEDEARRSTWRTGIKEVAVSAARQRAPAAWSGDAVETSDIEGK